MHLLNPIDRRSEGDLHTIVYVSTATSRLTAAELEAILTQSSDSNRENAVTGVLLYDNGSFMQCLEGPAQGMDDVYARVVASRQHTGIIELVNQWVAARSFSDWQMGFARPTGSELLDLATADWQRGREPRSAPGLESPGFRLLKEFWLRADRSSVNAVRQFRSPLALDGR